MSIVLVTYPEIDKDGYPTGVLLVSHGVDTDTLENVVLPAEPVHQVGRYSTLYNEWILK